MSTFSEYKLYPPRLHRHSVRGRIPRHESRVARAVTVMLTVAVLLACRAANTLAQEISSSAVGDATLQPDPGYVAITPRERIDWIVIGTVGPKSLGIGVFVSTWETAWNTPEEWGRSWSGFGKRYIAREVDVALSNSLEAGVGALWGEEPRYIPSRRHGIWPRARYAMKTVLLTQRRDGHLAPAWGRYVGNTVNNVIENAWLPPSITTPGATAWRCAQGFLGRLSGNLFDEFWPDVRRLVRNRGKPAAAEEF